MVKIFSNLDIRLMALILSLILWLHAVTEREYTVSFDCPVRVVNIPDEFALAQAPASVLSQITAKGKDIIILRFKSPRIVIDAGNRKVKQFSAKLSAANLWLPFELEAVQADFQPSEVVVKLDRLASKSVAVAVEILGQPAAGFLVSDSTFTEPQQVMLSGPERQMMQTDTIFTQPVRVDDLDRPARIKTGLLLPDPRYYRVQPDSVWVEIRLEKSGERLFKSIPLVLKNRGSGYMVGFSPGTVDIIVAGPQDILQRTSPEDIKALLDVKDLGPGQYNLQAVIELPEKVELIAANPRSFEVTVK